MKTNVISKPKVNTSTNPYSTRGVTYNTKTKELSVPFLHPKDRRKRSGTTYIYSGVPRRIVAAWASADVKGERGSAGKFFYHKIRTSYPYRKIKSPKAKR